MAFSGKGKKIIASIKKQSILKKFCVFIIVAVIATSLISGTIMYHYDGVQIGRHKKGCGRR